MKAAGRSASGRKKDGFLPAALRPVFARWAQQGLGGAFVVVAFILAAMLLTYDNSDPSWNTAVSPDKPIGNIFGWFGAIAADAGLQLMGAVAWLPVIAFFAWGARMITQPTDLDRFWVKILLLLSGMLLCAIGLAALPTPVWFSSYARFVNLGGSAGLLLLDGMTMLASLGGLPAWVPAVIAGTLGVLCSIASFGLSWKEWRSIGDQTWRIIAFIGRGFGGLTRMGKDMAAKRADPKPGRSETETQRIKREPSLSAKPAQPETVVNRDSLIIETSESAAIDDSPFDYADDEPEPLVDIAPRPAAAPAATALVAPKTPPLAPGKRVEETRQQNLDLANAYELPSTHLLSEVKASGGPVISSEALEQNARMLESVLEDFGVVGKIVKVRPGPVVTLYELEPQPGTKTSRVIGLADDIARSMSALSVRIATVPGRNVIGIELPNAKREMVLMRELLESDAFERAPSSLTLVLGKDIGGQPVMVDLARMPHLLIAGTTGSGKSVAINTMILSLLFRLKPEECRLIMIDPKMLELSVYDGIPHLLAPVVTEPGKAVVALKWAVREMEDRYRAMSQLGVRNIAGYNQRLAEAKAKGETLNRTVQTGFDAETGKPIYEEQALALEPLPFIVVVVDEMADLMLVAGKDVEAAIQRLAQMARAAGIHLIMATQRPSVDVITGTIKANFPTRISFQVTSKIDSRTILGEQGAEQLLGQGDMLYMAPGGRINRVHGPFVSDEEVEIIVQHLRNQGEPSYVDNVTEEEQDADASFAGASDSGDQLYDQAVAIVTGEGKASTSFIQRQLQIGYNRAARIIEKMEAEGVVSKANHVGKREVLARRPPDLP